MSHYALEQSATGQDAPFDEFFYPKHMFQDAQVTLNTLMPLKTPSLPPTWWACATSAPPTSASPPPASWASRATTALSRASSVATLPNAIAAPSSSSPACRESPRASTHPNNNGYERTQCWTDISQAVTALTPFVDRDAAEAAGFTHRALLPLPSRSRRRCRTRWGISFILRLLSTLSITLGKGG